MTGPRLVQCSAANAGHMIPRDDEEGFFALPGQHLQCNFGRP
jgi:N-formylmaleamate deformylase